MIALIRKDTAALLPYWLAVLCLVAIRATSLLMSPLGLAPTTELFAMERTDWQLLMPLVAFAIGHGSVASEVRDGHVEVLDALPIHRTSVFLSKVIAMVIPVLFAALAGPLLSWAAAIAFAHPVALSAADGAAAEATALVSVGLGTLGLGALLSWLGGLGWGVYLVGVLGTVVASIRVASLRPYVPAPFGNLGSLTWFGTHPVLPSGPILAWSAIGIVALLTSGVLFLGPGEAIVARGSRVRGATKVLTTGCGSLVWLLLCLLLALHLAIDQVPVLLEPVERESIGDVRAIYHTAHREQARARLGEVRALSIQIGALLGTPGPLALDIEMTGASTHAEGEAVAGKVRLATDADRRVLAHELAHAHAIKIAGEGHDTQWGHIRFFGEGLAEWVAGNVAGDAALPVRAGVIWREGQARFDLLVEDDAHSTRFDTAQVYPLGHVFVQALVEGEGTEVLGCLLGAIGAHADDQGSGIALWSALTTDCGVDLDLVLEHWHLRLAALSEAAPAELPQLEAWQDAEDPGGVRVVDRRELGWPLTCRFRDDEEEPFKRYVSVLALDGCCRIPYDALSGASFDMQVGYLLPGTHDSVMMPWVSLPWRD